MSRKALTATATAAAKRLMDLRRDWDAAADAADQQRCRALLRRIQVAEEEFAMTRPVTANEAALKLRHAAQLADMRARADGMPKGSESFIAALIEYAARCLTLLGADAAGTALEIVRTAETAEDASGYLPSAIAGHIITTRIGLCAMVGAAEPAAA